LETELSNLYERIKLPELYWKVSLVHIPDQPYKETVRDWIENITSKLQQGKGLYVYGTFGSGKSAIGAMLLRAALAHNLFGLWVNYRDLAKFQIENTSFDDVETYMQRICSVPLLVVDEFELKLNKQYHVYVLEDLVRTRHQKGKITVITSNHSPKYLIELKQSSSEVKRKEGALIEGLVGVMPEAFDMMLVTGRNFRKQPVKK